MLSAHPGQRKIPFLIERLSSAVSDESYLAPRGEAAVM
jgi:hypothetical protein